jgi:putative addiction module component (TIGR02574 family)
MTRCERIIEEINTLSLDERIEIHDFLTLSIEADFDADAYSAEWTAEIARRVGELERGDAKTIPAEEMFANIEKTLREMREARGES